MTRSAGGFAAAIAGMLMTAAIATAAEHRVASADEIKQALRAAKPGDVLVMNDGAWKDQAIAFSAAGKPDAPITLRAQTPGQVVLSGTSHVKIDGQHLVVAGLSFGDLGGNTTLIEINGTDNRVTECAVVDLKRAGRWAHFKSGKRNRLDHCYFEGHAPKDVTVQVEVEESGPNEHRIDHSHFGPRPPLGENGGETIRIGYSFQSMRNSRTTVEDNLFQGCDGELEIISSKSCENVYRGNTFRDSEGCLTLRHGNRCVVEDNYFLGNGPAGKPTGGVRVIGEGHVIRNNYFHGTSGMAGGAVVLTAGQPNAELTGYWHVTKADVTGNLFVENAGPVINISAGLGQRDRSLLPQNVTVANNVMVPLKSDPKPLVAGEQGENFKWEGNVAPADAQVGSAGASGIKLGDVKLTKGEDGIWRSPGAGPAAKYKPLSADGDVGPSWRKPAQGTKGAANAGKPAQPVAASAADAKVKSVELSNDVLTVRVDPVTKQASVRSLTRRGWAVEAASLCPEIINSGGVVVRQVVHHDVLGSAQAIELTSEGGVQRIWLHQGQPWVFTRATLREAGAGGGEMRNVTPIAFTVTPGAADTAGARLFGSDGLAKGDDAAKTSYVFLAVVEPGSNAGLVAGFLTHDRASGIVDCRRRDGQLIVAGRSEYGLPPLRGRKEERGETFVFGFFDDARIGLEQFADATARVNQIALPPVPSGYSTWYHARALDQGRMATLAAFAKERRLKDYGLDFLQIDDQWQVHRRDFTTHKSGEKATYPDGMRKTADAINAAGLVAGLWLTPFGWQGRDFQDDKPNENRTALKDNPGWFVQRADGGGIYWVRWAGDCLDLSHPDARKFLAGVVRRMTHDWNYKLLKIDGLWAGMACRILYPSPTYRDDGLGDAVFHDKSKTNVEVYRDGLKLVREAAGKDVFLLGCNIAQNMRTMGASIGLVDAMRVGPDIKADWAAVVRCARPATLLYFWNGRVWHNDPDCLMLREPLTLENGQAWASWIALSGQMNLVSEWLPDLPLERLDVYKRTIPNHRKLTARPVDLFDRDMPRIWHLTWGDGDDRHDVVGLFNWNAPAAGTKSDAAIEEPTTQGTTKLETGPVTITLDLAALGLPDGGGGRYVGFDFWSKRFLGDLAASQQVELPGGSCRVIALRRKLGRPQVVSTSRHVSQGAVDLTYAHWDAAGRALRGRSKVVAGDDYELRLDAAGAAMSGADVSAADRSVGVTASGQQDGRDLRVSIRSPQSREVEWAIRFGDAAAAR